MALTPWLQDADVTLYHGDALQVLRELPAESVDCCVTSPPYWGLRDYGSEGQLGLEPTPEEYVTRMVEVFREVRRVMAAHGTVWLNLGDSYAGSWGAQSRPNGNDVKSTLEGGSMLSARQIEAHPRGQTHTGSLKNTPHLKPKDLVGIPWRVAFALQADGWYLRSDIIWAKPNPMPESVTDRPTKAHEYVFLLSKQPRYFFDQEAVRERYGDPAREWWNETTTTPGNGNRKDGGGIQSKPAKGPDGRRKTGVLAGDGSIQHRDGERWPNLTGRNIRSVWEIATQPYPEAHFATFPEELARRCIAAGCPESVCRVCGKPARAEIVRTPLGNGPSVDPTPLTGRKGMNRERRPDEGTREITKAEQRDYAQQLRESPWRPQMEAEAGSAFAHYVRTDESGARPLPPDLLDSWIERDWLAAAEASGCGHDDFQPGRVLDPFIGSGTVAHVARKLGRHAIGIDLSAEYLALAAKRLQQQSLFAEAVSGL